MKKMRYLLTVIMILSIVLSGCGGLGSAPSETQNSDNNESNASSSSSTEVSQTEEVRVGLDKNVYEIPQYTQQEGVRIARISTSLSAADYGVTPSGVLFKTMVDEIEARSGGKIVLQIYPANQLASGADQIISSLASGAFEISELSAGSWGDYTTAFAPLNIPFLYKNIDVVHAIIDGEIGDEMVQQVREDCNVVPIGFMELGMRQMTNSSREIHAPADLSDLKIRVQSDPIQIAAFEALGGSCVSVPFSELFTALQQKLCEAQENPIHNIVSKKFYEVQPYLTVSEHSPTESILVLSGVYWETLSDEEKTWFEEAGKMATDASRVACQLQTETLLNQVEDYGITVTTLTPEEKQVFVDQVMPVWDMAEEIMGQEKWNELLKAVDKAETQLGL
ncbi:TRAP transporter substrate-binding protein [Fusibacter paucivorans]|uniref:TRAP transporter substrate-binding protein n=1 Tax=Fusibacter paucivorans TaxID=76009 RepID=A0ABS5PMN7_9FIRM|nr:TRAP transporter substrate-binding protein [Fusibacter paucivorans]MBS7526450.1 TRAP transporter substrate-binding protein [Fusibacter paucivorans]